jgi:hypothetical protein
MFAIAGDFVPVALSQPDLALFPNTYYLASIDGKKRRFYERTSTTL